MKTEIITERTFDEFGFRLPFNAKKVGTWTVTFNENLTEMTQAHTKTILLGICELMVGCLIAGRELDEFDSVELPPDFGCRGGLSSIQISPKTKMINVTGYFTCGFQKTEEQVLAE